jgi:hypothetical protein
VTPATRSGHRRRAGEDRRSWRAHRHREGGGGGGGSGGPSHSRCFFLFLQSAGAVFFFLEKKESRGIEPWPPTATCMQA